MKNKLKQMLSFCLCLVLIASFYVPAFADDLGVTYSLELSHSEVNNTSDQQVTMLIKLSKTVNVASIDYQIELPSQFELVSINGYGSITFNDAQQNTANGKVSWSGTATNADYIGTITFKSPNGTKAQDYPINVKGIGLGDALGYEYSEPMKFFL